MDFESFATGGGGCLMVNSSSGDITQNFYAFQVNEDAVVSAIYDKDGTDVINTYKLQSVTLKSGLLIYANEGNYFSKINLTSGSVLLLKVP